MSASGLVQTLVTGVSGYMLVQKGLANLRRTSVTPTNTIEALKETATWTNRTTA